VYGAPAPLLTTSPWDHVSRGKQKANAQFFENQIFLCKSEKNLLFPGIFFRFHLNNDSGAYLCSRFGKNVVIE